MAFGGCNCAGNESPVVQSSEGCSAVTSAVGKGSVFH